MKKADQLNFVQILKYLGQIMKSSIRILFVPRASVVYFSLSLTVNSLGHYAILSFLFAAVTRDGAANSPFSAGFLSPNANTVIILNILPQAYRLVDMVKLI